MKRLRHKFGAKPTEYDGKRYASKREARFAAELDMLRRAGKVVMYLEQVPLRLPGKSKYVVDFVVFYDDGTVRFVDVKGVETQMFRLKKRQVEELFPITIEVVK
jgi:hypothetical protein